VRVVARLDNAFAVSLAQRMAGDLLLIAEDQQLPVLRFLEQQLLPGVGGGDRVVVAVVADQAVSAATPVTEQAGVVVGFPAQGLQAFRRQQLRRHLAGRAMAATIGCVVQPGHGLAVQVCQVDEVQAQPEVTAHVTDPALHLAFSLRAVGAAGAWREAVVVGKVQVARVPVHRPVHLATHHRGLEVVVQHLAGYAAEIVKGMKMATQEPGCVGRHGELHIHGARPAQGHHKGVQALPAALVLDEAETAPVHLGLFARFRLEAHRGLAVFPRSTPRLHPGADQSLLALIATLLDLLVQLARVVHPLGQPCFQVRPKRVELGDPCFSPRQWSQHRLLQRGAHRLAVMSAPPRDLANGQAFAKHIFDHEAFLPPQHWWSSFPQPG
jgi:hypothetical protein